MNKSILELPVEKALGLDRLLPKKKKRYSFKNIKYELGIREFIATDEKYAS